MSITRPIRSWARTPLADLVVGAVVAAAYLAWRLAEQPALSVLDANARATVYTTLAGVSAALLAFGLTPTAIVLALAPGPRLKALLRHHSDEIRRALMTLLAGLLLLLTSSLVALAADTGEQTTRAMRYVVLAATIASLLSTARVIWHFNTLLRNVNVDNSASENVADLQARNRRAG